MTPDLLVQCVALALEPTDLPTPAHSLVIAHAALESGWGHSVASRLGYNHWNLTAGSRWTGDVVPGPDKEPDGDGGWKRITQKFRAYRSHYDAVADYLAFLRAGRYAKAFDALYAANGAAFVTELRAGGYFTAPLEEYLTAFAGCLARVRTIRERAVA